MSIRYIKILFKNLDEHYHFFEWLKESDSQVRETKSRKAFLIVDTKDHFSDLPSIEVILLPSRSTPNL